MQIIGDCPYFPSFNGETLEKGVHRVFINACERTLIWARYSLTHQQHPAGNGRAFFNSLLGHGHHCCAGHIQGQIKLYFLKADSGCGRKSADHLIVD